MKCSMEGCERRAVSRGWCRLHYDRWSRNGDPSAFLFHIPAANRFDRYVDRRADSCWLWTGGLNNRGYGRFYDGTRMVLAHRWAYEHFVGPIPDGLQLDHLCRVRHCVNPAHLEAVTNKVNSLRGVSPAAKNALKTNCPQGHPYDDANTWVSKNGFRQCRTCHRIRRRAQRRSR